MSLSRVKTWIAGETLTAADLNAEFNNILDNASSLFSPLTATLDADANVIILDSDGDTSITADTDDRIDVALSGTDLFRFDGTATTPVNGLTFTAAAASSEPSIDAFGSDTDVSVNLVPKGAGVGQVGGNTIAVLSTAQEWTATQNFNATTLSDGANISWNAAANQVASVTLGGNRTLDNPTNMVDGATYILIVKQDGTGSRTLAYGANYLWPGGTAPTLTTTASAVDILSFVSDGTNMYGVSQLDFS